MRVVISPVAGTAARAELLLVLLRGSAAPIHTEPYIVACWLIDRIDSSQAMLATNQHCRFLFSALVPGLLFASAAVMVTALTSERLNVDQLEALVPGVGTPVPPIGTNIDGESVFTNFVTAHNEGQFFILYNGMMTYEKPSAEAFEVTTLLWCSDLVFSALAGVSDQAVGYSGRCIIVRLTEPSDFVESGAGVSDFEELNTNDFVDTFGISTVFVPQMNALQGVMHKHTDNYVRVFWDDGRPTMAMNGWETHDAGDTSPNAHTSSWSNVATCRWLSAEQTASLLRVETSNLSPDKFGDIYEQVWNEMNKPSEPVAVDKTTGNENENEMTDEETIEEEEVIGTDSSDANSGQIPGRRRMLVIPEPGTLLSLFLRLIGL